MIPDKIMNKLIKLMLIFLQSGTINFCIIHACSRHNSKDFRVYDRGIFNISVYDSNGNYVKQQKLLGTSYFVGISAQANLPISADLVLLKSKDGKHSGCKPIKKTISRSNPWIGLVDRSECSDSKKAENAIKLYNASGLIIYVNRSEDMKHLESLNAISRTMDSGSKVMIFSSKLSDVPTSYTQNSLHGGSSLTDLVIIIGMQDGKNLVKLLNNESLKCVVEIKHFFGNSDDSNSNDNINKTSVLFVSISFIVLMIISLAWLVFYYIQRFRYAHAKERLSRRLMNAAKKAINKMPVKSLKYSDLSDANDQCAVCIEYYKTSEIVRTLPCKHVFHRSCIDPWLLEQRSCPMCKLDILKAYGLQVLGIKPDPTTILDDDSQLDPFNLNSIHFHNYSSSIAQVELHEPSVSAAIHNDDVAERESLMSKENHPLQSHDLPSTSSS